MGPALICWRPICFLFLSPLGLQPAEVFIKKSEEVEKEAKRSIFSGAEKRACWAIFLEQKTGVLGVFSLEQKISSGNFFVAAEQPDLYTDWVRSSSICFLI